MVRLGLQAIVVALFISAALLGTLSGLAFAYADDLPRVTALDDYRPSIITRLLARDGRVIGEFATERRVVIGYEQIAPVLRQAIIASEDAEFEQHFGLSVSRILVTAIKDVFLGQRFGASTITQQVARDSVSAVGVPDRRHLRPLRTPRHRAQAQGDAMLALQIERRYTKAEILTFYANQMNLGHGAYGVEAASRMYFDKSAARADARRGGDDRRHHPDAGPAEPVRQPGPDAGPTQQLRPAAHGRRRVHHRRPGERSGGASAGAQGAADAGAVERALLRRGHPQAARGPVRRRRASTKPGSPSRRRWTRRCSRRRTPRSTAGCDGSTSGAAATASRRATSSPKDRR